MYVDSCGWQIWDLADAGDDGQLDLGAGASSDISWRCRGEFFCAMSLSARRREGLESLISSYFLASGTLLGGQELPDALPTELGPFLRRPKELDSV